MKVFLFTFLVGLTFVGLLNLYVDPANRWHETRKGGTFDFQQNWNKDEIFITPDNFDERLYVISHLKVIPKPDILLLGSSRVMLVDSQMFNKDLSIFNAGVSGASIQDYIAIWQFLKNKDKLPTYLVIFLDAWVFNKNNGQLRWQTNLELYEQFSGSPSLKTSPLIALKRAKRSILEIADLFTWSILEKSLLILRGGIYQTGIVKVNKLPSEAKGKRFDGSLIYPVKLTQVPSLEEISKKSLEYTKGHIYSLYNWKFDENAYQDLTKLLKDVHEHGIRTLIVLPPYQHLTLKKLSELPDYKEALPTTKNTITTRLAKESEISFDFCNALDPVENGCAETEFMDGMHMLRICAEKVTIKCLESFNKDLLPSDGYTF